jgi:hypothetical protein
VRAFDGMRLSVVTEFNLDDFDLYDTRLLIGLIIDSVRDVVGHIFGNLSCITVVSSVRSQMTFTALHMAAVRTLRHFRARSTRGDDRGYG